MRASVVRMFMPNPDGWTIDTVLAHLLGLREADIMRVEQRFTEVERSIDRRFLAHQQAMDASLNASQDATEKVATAMDKRFESVNEFRLQLRDASASYITRGEVYALCGTVGAICGLIGGIVGHFFK
jgi:hypothetical protein